MDSFEATGGAVSAVELVALGASAELAMMLESMGLEVSVRDEPSEGSRDLIIAYEPSSRAVVEMMARQRRIAHARRVVLVELSNGELLQIGSECSSAHMRIGVAHPMCSLLVGLGFRTSLPFEPTLKVARAVLSANGESVWWAVTAVLKGSPDGASLKRAAFSNGVSRWTVRRQFMEETGLNPSRLMSRIRGALALGLLAQEQTSLSEVARSLGIADVRSLRRAIRTIVGEPVPMSGLAGTPLGGRLFERALDGLRVHLDSTRFDVDKCRRSAGAELQAGTS